MSHTVDEIIRTLPVLDVSRIDYSRQHEKRRSPKKCLAQ